MLGVSNFKFRHRDDRRSRLIYGVELRTDDTTAPREPTNIMGRDTAGAALGLCGYEPLPRGCCKSLFMLGSS